MAGLFENRSGLLLDLPQVGDVGDAHHHFGGRRGGMVRSEGEEVNTGSRQWWRENEWKSDTTIGRLDFGLAKHLAGSQ